MNIITKNNEIISSQVWIVNVCEHNFIRTIFIENLLPEHKLQLFLTSPPHDTNGRIRLWSSRGRPRGRPKESNFCCHIQNQTKEFPAQSDIVSSVLVS